MEKFNTNQKIVISLIASPILVYLLIGFLTLNLDITKWHISFRSGSIILTIIMYVFVFVVLDSFKQNKKK